MIYPFLFAFLSLLTFLASLKYSGPKFSSFFNSSIVILLLLYAAVALYLLSFTT
mgnify:CR=1 FL=1